VDNSVSEQLTASGYCVEAARVKKQTDKLHLKGNKEYTGVPPYLWVIRSTTYHGYMKSEIILNTIYNVIFV
jgi:hypothetical protein